MIKYKNKRDNKLKADGAEYLSDALVKLINLNNLNLNLQ
jgi:hypothetical protein